MTSPITVTLREYPTEGTGTPVVAHASCSDHPSWDPGDVDPSDFDGYGQEYANSRALSHAERQADDHLADVHLDDATDRLFTIPDAQRWAQFTHTYA